MMFKFDKTQSVFEVGSIRIGGQPGELPTVLIGSVFHKGHRLVKDYKSGAFDRKSAERLIKAQDEISEKTGLPCMLDVVGETAEAFRSYIDFVGEVTGAPFFVNGPNMSVRVSAVEYAKELGLLDRVVYTSINYTLAEQEIAAIKNTGIRTALVQAFNPNDLRPQGMLQILRARLLKEASKAGIEKPLIFMPVLDVPSVGLAVKGIYMAKEEFGLPTGTAPIGVIGQWKSIEKLGDVKWECRAGAAVLAQSAGANFIIYGSIAKARNLFPVCAMVDAMVAYQARLSGAGPLTNIHPLRRIF
jgi:tetrahydromethanopterin S-methyltransferase subunit H